MDGQFVERTIIGSTDGDHLPRIDANRIILGNSAANDRQGEAYIIEPVNGIWQQTATLIADDGARDDKFGESVAVSGDLALVGVPSDDHDLLRTSGSTYVFQRTDEGWQQVRKIVPAGPFRDFGNSVAVDGQNAIVLNSSPDFGGRKLHFYNGVLAEAGTALCTVEGHCICGRGFGGADCSQVLD